MVSTSTIHCESIFCTMEWQFYTDIVEGVYISAGKKLSLKRELRKNSQEDFFASLSREMTILTFIGLQCLWACVSLSISSYLEILSSNLPNLIISFTQQLQTLTADEGPGGRVPPETLKKMLTYPEKEIKQGNCRLIFVLYEAQVWLVFIMEQ